MKCLLINPPISGKNFKGRETFPLGLGYIATALIKAGVEVEILDIIGGSICSPNPKLLLMSTEADICCIGEGEETVVELCEFFSERRKLDDILGIAYKKSGDVVLTPNRPFSKDLVRFDYPSWELFDVKKYISLIPIVKKTNCMNLMGGRGCPYHCKFCSPSFRRTSRMRPVDSIISELDILVERYGIEQFKFSDELFFMRENTVREFCQKLIQRNYGLTWRALGRANILCEFSDETFRLLKESGRSWIGFGIESGSQRILDLMNKAIKAEQAEAVIKKLRKAGIVVSGNFIIGFPGETRESIRQTVEFCKRNLLPLTATICCPLPGTPLYEDCFRDGLITDEIAFWERIDDPFQEVVLNLTGFSDKKLIRLKEKAENDVSIFVRKYLSKENLAFCPAVKSSGFMAMLYKTKHVIYEYLRPFLEKHVIKGNTGGANR
jgi:radical SAM superfamily enzyme YgiQ (UPF0313 family)